MTHYTRPHTRLTDAENNLQHTMRPALLGMTTGEMVACVTLGAVWMLALLYLVGVLR